MAKVAGKINKVLTKDWNGTTLYSIEVGGKTYGTGSFPPSSGEGDYVEFDCPDPSAKFAKVSPRTLVKTAAPVGLAPAPMPSTGGGYQGKSDKTQEVISRQAARNSAIAFFGELRALEALPVPAKTTKAGEKFDLYLSILDEMTTGFFNYSMGLAKKKEAASAEAAAPSDPGMSDDNWEG